MGTNELLYQTETTSQHSEVPYGYQEGRGVGKGNEKAEMNRHARLCKTSNKSPLWDEDP